MSHPVVVSAPGKVILTGEHAVVYGKTAIATSVGLRCFVILEQTSDGEITLHLPDLVIGSSLQKSWPKVNIVGALDQRNQSGNSNSSKLQVLKGLLAPQEGGTEQSILDLAVLVFLHLMLEIYGEHVRELSGLKVTVLSDLPAGAGLGSSAAYSVCLSTAFLLGCGKIPFPTKKTSGNAGSLVKLRHIAEATNSDCGNGVTGKTWEQCHLDAISEWSLEAEKLVHGTPSGIDNTISTNGGAILYQSGTMKSLQDVSDLRVLLVNTRVPRSTKKMVAGVREKHDKFPSVVVPVLDSIDALSKEVHQLLEGMREKERAPALFKDLEELLTFNQHLLEALGVSHASIEEVCVLAKSAGLSAKLTGGGGGGCVLALIPPEMTAEDIARVQNKFEVAGFECWETVIGSSGAQVHCGWTD